MKLAHYANGAYNEFILVDVPGIPEKIRAKDRVTELTLVSEKSLSENAEPQPGDRVFVKMTKTRARTMAQLDAKTDDKDMSIDDRIDEILKRCPALLITHSSYGSACCDVKVKDKELAYEIPAHVPVEKGDTVLVPYLDSFETGEVVSIFRLKQVAAKY